MLSPRKAAEAAYELFCTPYGRSKKLKEPPLFHKAEKISFFHENNKINGFRWLPEHPNGKKVLIIHGFRSYSYKFEKYITPLRKEGFEVIAFDAPAHGISGGSKINALIYKRMLLEADAKFGPFFGWIGHSLGGLAASLAFEELKNKETKKLVLIAPATETEHAIQGFFSLLKVDDQVQQAFRQLLREITGKDVSYFSVRRMVNENIVPVLWVHDRQDTICPFEDVKPVIDKKLQHIQFLITEQLGHSKVYKDNKVCKEIIGFLSAPQS
jgi:alpha-beta hydrolase superfamily lysophospholipase